MALIDQNNVIFYHPLDDREEFTQNQNWTGNVSFVPGKVVSGAAPAAVIDNFSFGSGNLIDQTSSPKDRINIVALDEDTALIHLGEYTVVANISGNVTTTGTKISNLTGTEFTTAHKVSYSGGSGYALLTSYQAHPAVRTKMTLVSINGTNLTSIDEQNFTSPLYELGAFGVFNDGEHALVMSPFARNTMIVSISGGGFTSGVTQALGPASTKPHDIAPINNSGALVIYQTGDAYIVNCDFDNDIIIFGSGYSFSSTLANVHTNSHLWSSRALYLGDNKVLLAYQIGGPFNENPSYGRIAQISGTTITYGDEVNLSLGYDAVENSWTTNFIELSQLASGNILFSYEHLLDGGDDYLKYRILTIDGTTITVGDERVRSTDDYYSNLKAISPSSILGGYRDVTGASAADVFLRVGTPSREINVGISGINYPSTSGFSHISTAMWIKDPFPASGTEEILMEFGYYTRIRPSAILLGDDTTFNFVGSLSDGFMEGGDDDHEGHDGEDSNYILTNVSGFLNVNSADIILLHIGTNDIANGDSTSDIRDNISGICDTIWQWGVASGIDTRVVLARITNWSDPSGASGLATTELNGLLQTLGDDLLAAGNKISVVDMENALIYPTDISDNVHPTVSGYSKMADVWYPLLISGIRDFRQTTCRSDINIMPLGDSITGGYVDPEGYRMFLQTLLLSSGIVGVSWSGPSVQSVVSGINDGSDHFLMLDFQNAANEWTLRTSLDGSGWVNQGMPTDGSQDLLCSSGYTPGLFMTDGSDDQWIDEVAVWGGDFEAFTSGELSNLYNLGQTFDLPLSSYTETYQVVSGSIDLYVSGVIASVNSNIVLYVSGPLDINVSGDLFVLSHDDIQVSGDLFLSALRQTTSSGDLLIHGSILSNDNIGLYISGPIEVSGSISLFTFAPPPDLYDNISLYIEGLTTTSGTVGEIIDFFVKTADYSPQIIGTFDTIPASATIGVWSVINGDNIAISLTDDTCYRIGDTNSWRWSTTNLPTFSGTNQQFFYIMTSNLSETFEGQFFLDMPENAKWFHPRNTNLYIQ